MSGHITYLDASAVVKVLARENEAPALIDFLSTRPIRASSALLRVELLCTCYRRGLAPEEAEELLSDITLIPFSDSTFIDASEPFDPPQRALDAIHLAVAGALGGHLEGFVSYDVEQREAAASLGWAVHAPGLAI